MSGVRYIDRLTAALPATILIAYLFLSEPFSVILLFLSALAFHEWGHLTAFLLLGVGTPHLVPDGVGVRMIPSRPLLPREEFIIALSGPLCNILFALAALRLGEGDFFLLFAVIHLLFGLGNLLPFGGCDGERCLFLFFYAFLPRHAHTVIAALSRIFLSFFFFLSLFLYYLTGNGLCGVFFSLFFLFEEQKSHSNVF